MEQVKQGALASAKDLGSRVNALRAKLDLKPYSEPAKRGWKKLADEELKLQADWEAKNPPAGKPEPRRREKKVVEQGVRETVDPALLQLDVPETIRATSERLLMHVHRTDPGDKRTVGLMYGTIVELVKQKFPKAETTIECLRWYAVHMREEGKRLPQKRPRPSVRG